ncbi:MAG TPA: HAD-IA family hydrolase [Polyangia bacterium]
MTSSVPETRPSEALIFDCDGTLADTMPAHHQAWQTTLAGLGASFPVDRFYALAGVPTPRIARLLAEEYALTIDPDVLAARKEQAYVDSMPAVQPIEKVVAIARAARGRIPMAVASGSHRVLVEMTLAQIGVRDWFPVVVAAEDTQRHKPEPDVFLLAAERLGVPPEICVVYEDADLGIEAARRAGMRWVDIRRL